MLLSTLGIFLSEAISGSDTSLGLSFILCLLFFPLLILSPTALPFFLNFISMMLRYPATKAKITLNVFSAVLAIANIIIAALITIIMFGEGSEAICLTLLPLSAITLNALILIFIPLVSIMSSMHKKKDTDEYQDDYQN